MAKNVKVELGSIPMIPIVFEVSMEPKELREFARRVETISPNCPFYIFKKQVVTLVEKILGE